MTIKQFTKTCVALGGQASGINALLKYRRSRRRLPLIVGYHRVVEDFRHSARFTNPFMLTSARTFESQLDWIGRHYEFATLDELTEWMAGKRSSGKSLATVTFDDGYADVYHNAFPILKRKGIPSATFVVSGLVGTSKLQIHDELFAVISWLLTDPHAPALGELLAHNPAVLQATKSISGDSYRTKRVLQKHLSQAELERLLINLRDIAPLRDSDREGLLSVDWNMLAEMARNDVTVGSHTLTHAFLNNEATHKVMDEVSRSRVELSGRLQIPIDYFAYPDGRFDSRVVDAVRKAGYRAAFTICKHRDGRYPHLTIPRHILWERAGRDHRNAFSPSIMASTMHGLLQYSGCSGEHF